MTPSVLLVCVRNSGKSQLAAGLVQKAAARRITAYPAGTDPGHGAQVRDGGTARVIRCGGV